MQTTRKHVNGHLIYEVNNTEFFVYYDRSIYGQLKWVVGSKNKNLLQSFTEINDQLWVDKYEAVDTIKDFLKK